MVNFVSARPSYRRRHNNIIDMTPAPTRHGRLPASGAPVTTGPADGADVRRVGRTRWRLASRGHLVGP